MATLGVAVAGTGFGKQVHIPGLQRCEGLEVVAVYDRNLAKAQAVAQEFHIPRATDRFADLLEREDVRVVSISTPPFLHFEMARDSLQAGKHIILEKPVTMNAGEALELYHLARSRNLVAAVDFELRYIPQWKHFRSLIPRVGKKRLVQVEWLVQGRANPQREWNWYSRKELGGGALGALGSHVFDYLRWFFGGVRQLCAHLSTAIKARPDRSGVLQPVDTDDTCHILAELVDGTPVSISISTVTYQGRGHWLTVYGEEGTLVLGSSNLKDYGHGFQVQFAPVGKELEFVATAETFPEVFSDGRLAPFIALCQDFVRTVRGEITELPTLKDGVYSQQLMDLCHQSHHDRRWLSVSPQLLGA
ncbi:MAG: Gfo/Idh/MocA family oxidoreductase [Pseudanabaenaceae cyanobacterium SKYG29]|nr:Gfo/Idh/MocA family oxidoreductase [Pseudanabaenaceae cyanobacterium SKYG29]